VIEIVDLGEARRQPVKNRSLGVGTNRSDGFGQKSI
jgi:hypothetical protein